MLEVNQWICCLRGILQKPFMKLFQFQIDHYEDCHSWCNRPNRWNLGFHFAYWRNVRKKSIRRIFCFRPTSSSTSSWLGTLSDSFGKRILFSRPFVFHLLSALFHICHTTQVRSPDKLAHITNPSLTVTECDVFRFYLLFPLSSFPLCQNLIQNLSQEQLSSHLGGHDAVLSCLGFKPQKPAVTWVQLYKQPSYGWTWKAVSHSLHGSSFNNPP